MMRNCIGLGLLVALILSGAACQKLPDSTSGGTQLPAEKVVRADAIPASWGNLVSVSAVGQYPDVLQLWFQDDQKVIRVVVVSAQTMAVLHARVISRN
jgi:hypothetical protein